MLSAGRPVSGGVMATSDFQVSSAHRTSVARSTPAGSPPPERAPNGGGEGLGRLRHRGTEGGGEATGHDGPAGDSGS